MHGFFNLAAGSDRLSHLEIAGSRSFYIPALLGLLMLAFLAAPPAHADGGATLTVTPSVTWYFCGESADVTYTYTPDEVGTPELRGYSIRVVAPYGMTFDVTDFTVNSPLVGVNDTHYIIANGQADYTVDFTFLDPGASLTAEADLFTLTFHDKGFNIPNRELNIDSGRFRTPENQDIVVDISSAPLLSVVCVAPAPPPVLDPLPEYSPGESITVSWEDAAWVGAVAYFAMASTDPGFSTIEAESGWIPGLSYEFTGLSDGQLYYFAVKARNYTEMVSRNSNIEQSILDGVPPTTTLGVPDPVQYLVDIDLSFLAFDALSGFAGLELFYRFEGGPWASYGVFSESPIAFTATDGDGQYQFYSVGTDVAGNVEDTPSGPQIGFTLDTSEPYGDFVINAGAVATKSADVTLNISVIRADEMRFSNDGSTWPEGWVSLTGAHSWSFDPVEQIHTVYGEFRDAALQVLASDDDIEYDVTPTGPVTGAAAAPGNEAVLLSWSNPADPDFHAVEVWRAVLHDGAGASTYPSYIGSTVPTPAADRDAAQASSEWQQAGVSDVGASTYADSVAERGVYYYEFFAMDPAGNYSVPEGTTPRATNYILGDVASPTDGLVTVGDMSLVGTTFGLVGSDPLFTGICDVGPTDDGLGTGIPQPDDQINFKDQMIFGMNYQPTAKSRAATTTGSPVVVSLAWRETEAGTWELALTAPSPSLKGLCLSAALPAGLVPEVRAGEALASLADPISLLNNDRRGLEAGLVVLGQGRGITVTGPLLTVTLPAALDGAAPAMTSVDLDLRDLNNQPLEYDLQGKSGGLPSVFALGEAIPNPFNPSTTIRFSIPGETSVRLEIYGLDGRKIAVLVDEVLTGGSHEAVWLGRDETGQPVASGVYFSRLLAGPHSQVRKLTLMK